jgi:hypothetical protein
MNKIKRIITSSVESDRGKNILTILVVILVGLGSFGLGRLSKDTTNSDVDIKYLNQEANTLNLLESQENRDNLTQNDSTQVESTIKQPKGSISSVGKVFFASSRGSKYYSIGCSGGKTLKPENKIYFTTEAEAIAAGYEKSSTCK